MKSYINDVNRYILAFLGGVIVIFHGGMMYNTVAYQTIMRSDPALMAVTMKYPHILADGTAYYLIGDIVGGSVLNPVMDIIGPRYFALLGHALNGLAYATLAYGPRNNVENWFIPVMFTLGCALQLCVNSTMLLGNKFGKKSAGLVVILLGASCEFSLPLSTAWIVSGISLITGAKILLFVTLLTGTFVLFCFGDTYESFQGEPCEKLDGDNILGNYVADDEYCPSEENETGELNDRALKEVAYTGKFFKSAFSYSCLFLAFQCQTTYWSSTTSFSPLLQKCFYWGSFTSVVFGFCAGFVAVRFTAMTVAKYYYTIAMVISLALAVGKIWSMLPATFMYFGFKACIFTVWFAVVNESFNCRSVGTLFAVPQFVGSAAFWLFNRYLGPMMDDTPNRSTKLVWLCMAILMLSAIMISWNVHAHQRQHHPRYNSINSLESSLIPHPKA